MTQNAMQAKNSRSFPEQSSIPSSMVASPDFLTFSADGFQPTRVGKQNVQHLSVSTFGRFLKKPLDLATKNGN